MILKDELDAHFENAFEDWEKNRMYPPNHRRISMIKINDRHLIAIARARHFMQSGITKAMEPKFIDKIERDLVLLSEIHSYCRQQIVEPGLPMTQGPIDVGEIAENVGSQI